MSRNGLPLSKTPFPGEWVEEAACRAPGVNAAVFYPALGENTDAAKAVCVTCPVMIDCREYALSYPDLDFGVWGGLSADERRSLRRRRRRAKAV